MNYIGSKHRLSNFLKDEITKVVKTLHDKSFCDLFAGSGIVSRAFKSSVQQVVSNDIEYYSYIINKNFIANSKKLPNLQQYIDTLNSLELIEDGFIYKHYCKGSGSNREYFSDKNGKKIDTIRVKIQSWLEDKTIDKPTYYFLLTSLLYSADKVANTASVYSSFLKKLKKTAQKEMILKPQYFEITKNTNTVYNLDSNQLIKDIKGDILYLDPPYNQRQYGASYHLLNTIALYDNITPSGKTGRRKIYHKSTFASSKHVHKSFQQLIENADFKYIFLSYNNEGLMSKEFIKSTMKKYGSYTLVKKEYKKFHTLKSKNFHQKADKTYEYLHILEKN